MIDLKRIPASWRSVPLRECTEIVSGSTPSRDVAGYWGGTIAWATPKDLSGLNSPVLDDTSEYITEEGFKSCSTQLLPRGAVLFSSRAPIGLVAIAGRPMCTNQGFKSFIPGPDINGKYLYYCLREMVPQIQALGNGATFKEVSKAVIGDVRIPVPPRLEEQQRIAAILEKADAIRQKRKSSVALMSKMGEALLMKTIGDPCTNPMSWPARTIGQLVDPERPITYGILKPGENTPDGVPMLRIQDIKGGRIQTGELHRVTAELSQQYRRTILHGDEIVISLVGTIGLVAMVPMQLKGANLHRNLGLIVSGPSVQREFLFSLLSSPRFRLLLQRTVKGGNQALLNLSDLSSVEVPVPPLDVQSKFVASFHHVTNSADSLRLAEQAGDELFSSLVSRAFQGEL